MAGKKRQGRVGGRDSITGQFIPVEETRRRPATTQREIIPLPGYGDSGRGGKGNNSSNKKK